MCERNESKSVFTLQTCKTLALVLAGFWLAGCASTAYHERAVAARSMDTTAADLQAESRALAATMATLDDLVKNPAPDLRPQLKRFSNSLDRLVAASQRAEAASRDMSEKNAAYFAEWDKQLATMQYDSVRSSSEAHKVEMTNHVETVKRRCLETESAVCPVIAYLQDIRTALRADLTVGGLDAVKGVVANADQNAEKLAFAFEKLSADLSPSSNSPPSVATASAGSTQ